MKKHGKVNKEKKGKKGEPRGVVWKHQAMDWRWCRMADYSTDNYWPPVVMSIVSYYTMSQKERVMLKFGNNFGKSQSMFEILSQLETEWNFQLVFITP